MQRSFFPGSNTVKAKCPKVHLIVIAQYCNELLEVNRTGYYTVALCMLLHNYVNVFFFLYPFHFYKINTKRLFKFVLTGRAICGLKN